MTSSLDHKPDRQVLARTQEGLSPLPQKAIELSKLKCSNKRVEK